jgi:hypothetical protein
MFPISIPDYMRTLKVEVEMQSSFVDMYRGLLTACGYDKRVADMPPMIVSADKSNFNVLFHYNFSSVNGLFKNGIGPESKPRPSTISTPRSHGSSKRDRMRYPAKPEKDVMYNFAKPQTSIEIR